MIKIDREALRELCREYDKCNGVYPENKYEGLALYTFFREKEIMNKYWNDASLKREIEAEFEMRESE